MLKHVALALVLGVGLGAGQTFAQTNDKTDPNDKYDRTGKDDKNVFEKGKDKLLGKNDGARDEKLKVGVLKLSIEDVQAVKQSLVGRGYALKNVTGKSDDELEEAIGKFQRDVGIKKTGDIDVATLNALGFTALVAIHPDVKGSELAQGEPTSTTERPAGMPQDAKVVGGGSKDVIGFLLLGKDQLEGIQERLKDEGYYRGDANGAFTKELVDAVKRFQQAKGVKSTTGALDLATLAWFPDAKIKVDVTDKPENEISEPTKAGFPAKDVGKETDDK